MLYSFHLPFASGFDIRVQSVSGDPINLDTVLELRAGDCNVLPLPPSATCSDDSNPPVYFFHFFFFFFIFKNKNEIKGGGGSGIRASVPAGNYTILISSYNEESVGPYVLTAAFFQDQCKIIFCIF